MRLWLVGIGVLVWARGAAAQFAVYDAANYAENVAHLAKAAEELRAAQSQITNQLQALKKLMNPSWRSVVGTVRAVDGGMASANGIGYAVAQPGRELLATYPGVRPTDAYHSDERVQTSRALATLGAGIDAAHAQAETLEPGVQQVDDFKRQTAGVQGHEQALELQGSVAVFNAQELLLLRQVVATQSAMQAVYYAHEVNVRAQAEENAGQVVAVMAQPVVSRPPFSLRMTP